MEIRRSMFVILGAALLLVAIPMATSAASACMDCHEKVTPNIVKDFLSGEMGKSGLDC